MELADLVTDRASLIGAANTLIFAVMASCMQTIPMATVSSKTSGKAHRVGTPRRARRLSLVRVARRGRWWRRFLMSGVPEILIANRTRVRAEALQSDFGKRVRVVDWVQAGNMIEEAATVVNTTSLGMMGKPDLRKSRSMGCKRAPWSRTWSITH